MRHRVSGRKLGRTASHRKATLSSLSTSLIEHKRIITTVAKAKETQRKVDRLITRAKSAYLKESAGEPKDVAARREISKIIKNRTVLRELFEEIAPKVSERNGGYTRVVKLGQRDGDGAHVAVLELVDYNEVIAKKEKQKKAVKAAKTAAAAKKAADEAAAGSESTETPETTQPAEEKKSSEPTSSGSGTESHDDADTEKSADTESDK
jgi:large subunit ribosomal protein L17